MPPSNPTASTGAHEISYEELRRRLHNPALAVVDVLPRESYESDHLPGALSLPLAEVRARAPEVVPDRLREIAVYCGGQT